MKDVEYVSNHLSLKNDNLNLKQKKKRLKVVSS